MNKTQWFMTDSGVYVQFYVPEWEGFHEIEPPTQEERITAAMNYMNARYREVISFTHAISDSMAALAETFEILTDPETMEAIREAKAETDDTD